MSSLTYYFVKANSPLMDQLWNLFDNPFDKCPDSGEVWQYMGSVKSSNKPDRHEFRHRNHPAVKARVYRRIYGSLETGFEVFESHATGLVWSETVDPWRGKPLSLS
jgi:hypothetical protein